MELTKRLHQISGVKRIRFGSLEPRLITEEFAREMCIRDRAWPDTWVSWEITFAPFMESSLMTLATAFSFPGMGVELKITKMCIRDRPWRQRPYGRSS